MDWTYTHILLLVFAGLAAGFVNTLAGNGSVFTLSALLFLGLPADIANGTNRVGVMTQGALAIFNLSSTNNVPFRSQLRYIIPTVLGALIGVRVVIEVDKDVLQYVIGGVMVLLLVLILTNAKSFTQHQPHHANQPNKALEMILLFAVGFYGGFLQMGIGIMLLLTLTLVSHITPLQSNFLKLVIVFVLTIPVLTIFYIEGQVNLQYGISLAAGQGVGAWLASKYAVKSPKAVIWMKNLLIGMIMIGLIKIFFPWHWWLGI